MEYVLAANALKKRYGNFLAINNLSMKIPRGSIYGLVGKNGSGKTTLLRLICGLQEPTFGEYALFGVNCKDKTITKTRRRMGAVVETPSIYLDMTAEDNLKEQYRILGLPSFEEIRELLELVGLGDMGKKKAKSFSLGMKQRLGIAVALCGRPDFIALDEPVNGLDPQGIVDIRELMIKLNREYQITFLISSHILSELSRLATHYGFIDKGYMLKEISASDLEAACRKCIRITVSDVRALCQVLDDMHPEYSIISDCEADIYGSVNVTGLTMALAKENCEVRSMREKDEDLENYYINLVGGGTYE
jgi:ABC-2 type transport system ATP-binding protein